MKIAVLGVGAVGGWFGGSLAQAGHDVTFVARGDTLRVLQDIGLTLNDAPPVPVHAVAELAGLDVDVVLLAVKATGQDQLRESLADFPAGAVVAVTQNSVEVPHLVADAVGRRRVWPGVVRGFFHHTGPGRVEFHGGPISYAFGAWGGEEDPAARAFADALTGAGIQAHLRDDVFVDVWEKAMFVTCFGALGSAAGAPLGHLRTHLRGSLQRLMEEVAAVARATGTPLAEDAVARTMAFADRMPAGATSSMQRDLAAGRESELEAQVGAIVRLGTHHGVDTHLHELLYGLLR
jgi:2-dehydropantoate 2-reductase